MLVCQNVSEHARVRLTKPYLTRGVRAQMTDSHAAGARGQRTRGCFEVEWRGRERVDFKKINFALAVGAIMFI